MDIAQYLSQNYPRVSKVEEVIVDGEVKGYTAKAGSGDQLYIPKSALNNSSVGMVSYIPGAGGSGNDGAALRDRIKNNPPDYIVSIAASCSDRNNCLETGYAMAKGMNINVTNNVTVCFSASGYRGIDQVETFTAQHPEVKNTVVSCEPYGGDYIYTNKQSVSAMQQNGTKVIFVTPKNFHVNMSDSIKAFNEKGVETYWLQTNYTGSPGSVHTTTNRDVINSGMLDYILGYSNDFSKEPGGDKYSPGYQLIGVNPQTGETVYADYAALAQAGVGMVQIPDVDKLKSVDNFNIEKKTSPVTKKYASLTTGTNTDIKSKDGSVISSEYTYVSTTMNEIKNQVKQSSFLSGFSNLGFRSSSGIPGCIMGYLNTYFDVVGSLLNSLSLEADATISYGQAMVDMDYDLKHGASEVGTIYESDNTSKIIKPGGLEAFEEKTKEEEKERKDEGSGSEKDSGSGSGSRSGSDSRSGAGSRSGSGSGSVSSSGSSSSSSGGSSSVSGASSGGSSSSSGGSSTSGSGIQQVELRQTDPVQEKTTTTTTETSTETSTEAKTSETPQVIKYVRQEVPAQEQQPAASHQEQVYYNEPAEYTAEMPMEETPIEVSSEIPTEIVPLETTKQEAVVEETDIPLPTAEIESTSPSYTKIPISENSIDPTPKKKGNAILPVFAGLTVAAAAGIGAKAYIDHKTNKNNGEDYYDDSFEDAEKMDFSYNEEEPIEDYTAKTSDELADMQ